MLQEHSWPGNVRELENALMQAMIMTRSDVLEKEHILLNTEHSAENVIEESVLIPISEIEKVHIQKVLDKLNWNKLEASRILEITRPTLNAKILRYGLKSNAVKRRKKTKE
jgi:two-component system response regulator AtoC